MRSDIQAADDYCNIFSNIEDEQQQEDDDEDEKEVRITRVARRKLMSEKKLYLKLINIYAMANSRE